MRARRLGKADIFGWVVLLGFAGFLFQATLGALFSRWWKDSTYSHGFLVPAVSLFFLYDRRERLKSLCVGGSLWGVPALAAALCLFYVGRLGNMVFVQAAAFIAVLGALAVLAEGWGFLRAAAFPILFLIFMCPLPSSIYDPVSAQLRLFASSVATVFLQMLGVVATRWGNVIYLSEATLSVDDACSGIRSLFGIAATATAFAYMTPGGLLRKAFLVVSAAPIAVFSNILRVTGTGLLYRWPGGDFAEGFYHSVEGWVFYVMALAALFGEFFLLKAIFPVEGARGEAKGAPSGEQAAAESLRKDGR